MIWEVKIKRLTLLYSLSAIIQMSFMYIIFLFSSQALKVWSLNGKKIIIFCKKLYKYWISTYYNLLPLHWQLREILISAESSYFSEQMS